MKAAVLFKSGENLEIVDGIEMPPLQPGQVLVRLAYSGVCRSQIMEQEGKRGVDRYLPHLLGHEGSGTVVEIGIDVSKISVGDLVVLTWIKGTGLDVAGPTYQYKGQVLNAGALTTFNDFAVVSENRCIKLSAKMPLDCAVLFGCALPTGAGMVFNQIQPKAGSRVAVFGLGGVGLSALLALQEFECSEIIAVDISKEKLALAKTCGATQVFLASDLDLGEQLANLDYAIEATGQIAGIERAFAAVKKFGGRCVFASHPESGQRLSLDPHDFISGKQLEGSWGGNSNPDQDIPRLESLYLKGRLPLEKFFTQQYTLEDINLALADLRDGKVLRPLIKF